MQIHCPWHHDKTVGKLQILHSLKGMLRVNPQALENQGYTSPTESTGLYRGPYCTSAERKEFKILFLKNKNQKRSCFLAVLVTEGRANPLNTFWDPQGGIQSMETSQRQLGPDI